jgi:hypothetical protein
MGNSYLDENTFGSRLVYILPNFMFTRQIDKYWQDCVINCQSHHGISLLLPVSLRVKLPTRFPCIGIIIALLKRCRSYTHGMYRVGDEDHMFLNV